MGFRGWASSVYRLLSALSPAPSLGCATDHGEMVVIRPPQRSVGVPKNAKKWQQNHTQWRIDHPLRRNPWTDNQQNFTEVGLIASDSTTSVQYNHQNLPLRGFFSPQNSTTSLVKHRYNNEPGIGHRATAPKTIVILHTVVYYI